MGWLNNFITSHINKSYSEDIIKRAHSSFDKPNFDQESIVKSTTKKVLDSVESKLESKLIDIKFEAAKNTREITEKLTNRIIALEKELKNNSTIHVIKSSTKTREIKGIVHEMFDTVLTMVNKDIPVFLSGPAGCGKNYLCKQVADALGLDFYFTNAVTQEYRLTGFIDASGIYHETEFYKAATKGGLFFLDEIDGSIPEVLILLNAAIANRYFDFPNGRVTLHPNFRIIAAGNTAGSGGDSLYTGRTRLDAASLDRFCLVRINYSKAIERAITNNNKELLAFAAVLRKNSNLIISYRALIAITLLEGSLELTDIIKMSILKGSPADVIRTIQSRMQPSSNKYIQAFMCL